MGCPYCFKKQKQSGGGGGGAEMAEVLPYLTRLHAVFTIWCQSLQLHELPLDLYSVKPCRQSAAVFTVRFYSHGQTTDNWHHCSANYTQWIQSSALWEKKNRRILVFFWSMSQTSWLTVLSWLQLLSIALCPELWASFFSLFFTCDLVTCVLEWFGDILNGWFIMTWPS